MEVYLDNSATTMCYPEVGELVYKVMCRDYGNPSSMHRKGVQAEHYIRDDSGAPHPVTANTASRRTSR